MGSMNLLTSCRERHWKGIRLLKGCYQGPDDEIILAVAALPLGVTG
jgi:hypothetical protein